LGQIFFNFGYKELQMLDEYEISKFVRFLKNIK